MTPERYKELTHKPWPKLSQKEIDEGWCFCWEWDGLLINKNVDEEAKVCKNCPK